MSRNVTSIDVRVDSADVRVYCAIVVTVAPE